MSLVKGPPPSWFAALLCLGLAWLSPQLRAAADLATAAHAQIGRTTGYDPSYRKLAYPGGDVPIESGVCTDVVIRALRSARALDLQQLVHEDMAAHFAAYPGNWGLKAPDRNIDHRRVPNLQTYFRRRGWELPASTSPRDYLPGDLVTCLVPPNRPHIMVVSGQNTAQGEPLVIHNIGAGTREEALLFAFKITGRYRLPPPPASSR